MEKYYIEEDLQYSVIDECATGFKANVMKQDIEKLIRQCVTANSEYEDIRSFAKAIIEIKRRNPAEYSKNFNISNGIVNKKVPKKYKGSDKGYIIGKRNVIKKYRVNSLGYKRDNTDENYDKCKRISALIGFAIGAALFVIGKFFFFEEDEEDNVYNETEHSASNEPDHIPLGPEITGKAASEPGANPEFKVDKLKLAASVFGVLGTSITLSLFGIKLIGSTGIANKIRQDQANDLEKRIKNVKLLRGQTVKIRKQMISQKSKTNGKQN